MIMPNSRLTIMAALAALALAGVVQAQDKPDKPAAAAGAEKTANPELVGDLAKEIGATPQQAEGAAGALFGLAKSRLSPADWTKVAGAVPGMDGLLKAAPAVAAGTTGAISSMAGQASGLASTAGAFSKLGLKPEMASKAVPVLTKYVTKSGGPEVASLLAGALK
jgi:Protein of unknown function VcgC/VcgE (DUF2780)